MAQKRKRPLIAAGIIERHDNRVLIALIAPGDESHRLWQFPRGLVREGESPEAGMRRICREDLRLSVEVVVGQPPLQSEIDGQESELRYFFCGILTGEGEPGRYEEIRWVSRGHLREYEFDQPSQQVVDWVLEERG